MKSFPLSAKRSVLSSVGSTERTLSIMESKLQSVVDMPTNFPPPSNIPTPTVVIRAFDPEVSKYGAVHTALRPSRPDIFTVLYQPLSG